MTFDALFESYSLANEATTIRAPTSTLLFSKSNFTVPMHISGYKLADGDYSPSSFKWPFF
jgi:hypothetical protein